MDYAIGVISKTSCLPEAHKDFFSPMFSSQSFIVLALTFKSDLF